MSGAAPTVSIGGRAYPFTPLEISNAGWNLWDMREGVNPTAVVGTAAYALRKALGDEGYAVLRAAGPLEAEAVVAAAREVLAATEGVGPVPPWSTVPCAPLAEVDPARVCPNPCATHPR